MAADIHVADSGRTAAADGIPLVGGRGDHVLAQAAGRNRLARSLTGRILIGAGSA